MPHESQAEEARFNEAVDAWIYANGSWARDAARIALRAVQGGTARPRVYGYAKRRVENALRRLRKLEQEAAARGEKRY